MGSDSRVVQETIPWCYSKFLRIHITTRSRVLKLKIQSPAPFLKSPLKVSLQALRKLLLLLSHFSRVSNLCDPTEPQPTRLPHPWDSPCKNTGLGCHFLLQCIKVKTESEVTQSCPTLSDPMDCSLPGSSIHGIFQEGVLEWGAIAFSD